MAKKKESKKRSGQKQATLDALTFGELALEMYKRLDDRRDKAALEIDVAEKELDRLDNAKEVLEELA